jgi:hypothetical protein
MTRLHDVVSYLTLVTSSTCNIISLIGFGCLILVLVTFVNPSMLISQGKMHGRSERGGEVRNREKERTNGRKKELRELRFSKRC